MKRRKLASMFFAAAMLACAASVGAVDGTIEINQAKVLASGGFPYAISASGSYRLTGNLTVPPGSGINVTANNVTIDLNGFTIKGAGASGAYGIIGSTATGTTVENGTVTGFINGVVLNDNSIVKSVHADSNSNAGIAAGANSVIEGCTANSDGDGIQCTSGCTISGNTLNKNSFDGIYISGSSSLIVRNTISNNTSTGIDASDKTTGYGENVLNGNSVLQGTSLGHNLCTGGTVC